MSFRPTAELSMLRRRAELLAKVRDFFAARSFLEVETPVLSRDVVVDRHLDPLRVTLFDDPREPARGEPFWLQTSPEFGMKRLLAAFAEELQERNSPLAIFQVARAFRGAEAGKLHNPEFTLVEWYRTGDDYRAGMDLLDDFSQTLLARGPAERITYRDAFLRYAATDPWQGAHDQLALDRLLVEKVEPNLGRGRPTIVYDYPAEQSALAQVRPGKPPVAERFELYVDGVELANGYHELLDAAALRERNRLNNAARVADGKFSLPAESRLLEAMEHGLPRCAGCALGFDRLVMVATGARSIQEVIAFPIDRA